MIGKITIAIAVLMMIVAISLTPLVLAFKLTKTSYKDGYNRGATDASNDFQGLNGHGYDDSCPSAHTDTYCQGYVNGYKNTWNNQDGSSGGATSTQPQSQAQSQGQSQSQSQGITNNNNPTIIINPPK